jgi:hypothetical protein
MSSVSISAHCARIVVPDVSRLGAKLGIDPMELLQMINGEMVPTRAVISALAKELHCMFPSSRNWPLKSNRDTGQNTGCGLTVVRCPRQSPPDEPYIDRLPQTNQLPVDHAGSSHTGPGG